MIAKTQELAGIAQLVGQLLLREIDASLRDELLRADVAECLEGVGVNLAPLREDAGLDHLASEYFEAILRPEEGPLVQSLWVSGAYESECTANLRKLAKAAGLELNQEAARRATPDHLGVILTCWAESAEIAPAVAHRIASEHLQWAEAPLARLETRAGFYGQLSALIRELIIEIRATTSND